MLFHIVNIGRNQGDPSSDLSCRHTLTPKSVDVTLLHRLKWLASPLLRNPLALSLPPIWGRKQ
jgi:hypothetical protein